MNYVERARRVLDEIRAEGPMREKATQEERSLTQENDLATRIGAMRISEFAQAGLIVTVSSSVLGRQVLFVSDNVPASSLSDLSLPVYRAAELMNLARFKPEPKSLRKLHEVREIFGGVVTDVEE